MALSFKAFLSILGIFTSSLYASGNDSSIWEVVYTRCHSSIPPSEEAYGRSAVATIAQYPPAKASLLQMPCKSFKGPYTFSNHLSGLLEWAKVYVLEEDE